MEIHQNPLFFHENIFFLIRKSPNTPNSIFRANIRNLLLRARMGGVMVSVLVSSAVDRGFEPRSGQTNNYKIVIFCFSAKQAAIMEKDQGLVGSESG